jgi:carbon-monoxide dehydrogenase medium subunit
MYAFQYHRPASVADACTILAGDGDAKLLAGGQTLLASLKLRLAQPSKLVDLGRVADLKGIALTSTETLAVGAMVTHHEAATSALIARQLPALAHLASHIGDPMVRRMGTLGGSIANNDPAADYPAALLALDAVVRTSTRSLRADEFFLGMFQTALAQDELVMDVSFRIPKLAAYAKFRHPASRFAVVGVFVAQFDDGVRVAVTGAGPSVFRVAPFELALQRRFAPASLQSLRVGADGLNSDLQATSQYRAHLVGVMAQRAVEAALGS